MSALLFAGSPLRDINSLSIHFGDLRLALLRKASKDARGDRIDGCTPLKGTVPSPCGEASHSLRSQGQEGKGILTYGHYPLG
jgi:hypothetical protein